MKREPDVPVTGSVSFWLLAAFFAAGFATLAVRLKEIQVDNAAQYLREMQSQSFRVVRTAGSRGRILDRNGAPLAENSLSINLVVSPEAYRARKRGESTEAMLSDAIASVEKVVGRPPDVSERAVRRHLRVELARPLVVWRDVTEEELARFSEHSREFPGFDCVAEENRVYPEGAACVHLVGRVGRESIPDAPGGTRANYSDKDLCGREGIEYQYDEYLRGMPGEDRVLVDARGFATARETLVEPRDGFDLTLTVDAALQRKATRLLDGLRGACVAIDPRDGSIRAMVSAPGYDPGVCVPVLNAETYAKLAGDPSKPMLNRATAGTYAPGSTFKPMTALAALAAGIGPADEYECVGFYELGGMKIRCSRTWGHGDENLARALRDSCNPYFCHAGVAAGTNLLLSVCREFGLGMRTGIDFPTDAAGLVPDAAAKAKRVADPAASRWRLGDLAQMSIGQGLLLVTPLQMARVAAALGSGSVARPRLNAALPPSVKSLDIPRWRLDAVREGMRLVVAGGTGRLAGEGVDANVIGKTGTAQVGLGPTKRKNVWFIAYATPTAASRMREPLAVALVVENGESGGGTAAPLVASLLRAFYNYGEGEDAS